MGAVDRGTEAGASNSQRRAVQRDHRAHGEHSALHGSDGAARHAPEAHRLRRAHRNRQKRVHHSECVCPCHRVYHRSANEPPSAFDLSQSLPTSE